MANYYYIKIESEKLTQDAVAEIFNYLAENCRVRWFDFSEGGLIKYNTRGLTDISKILEKYGITNEEIEIEDEFERFYNSLSPEELKEMEEEAKRWREEEEKLPKATKPANTFDF